jgi:hypothetical protein
MKFIVFDFRNELWCYARIMRMAENDRRVYIGFSTLAGIISTRIWRVISDELIEIYKEVGYDITN